MNGPVALGAVERAAIGITSVVVAGAILAAGDDAAEYAGLAGWLAVLACTAATVGAGLAAVHGRWSLHAVAAVWLATFVAPYAADRYSGPLDWGWVIVLLQRTTWSQAVGAALLGASLLLSRRVPSVLVGRAVALLGISLLVLDLGVISAEAARVPLPGIRAMGLLGGPESDAYGTPSWTSGWAYIASTPGGSSTLGLVSAGAAAVFALGVVATGVVVFVRREAWNCLAWGALLLAFLWPAVLPDLLMASRAGVWPHVGWTGVQAVYSGAVSLVLLASATAAAIERASRGRTRCAQALQPHVVSLEHEALG